MENCLFYRLMKVIIAFILTLTMTVCGNIRSFFQKFTGKGETTTAVTEVSTETSTEPLTETTTESTTESTTEPVTEPSTEPTTKTTTESTTESTTSTTKRTTAPHIYTGTGVKTTEGGTYVRSATENGKYSFGGTLNEVINAADADSNGNFYCCGYSLSKNGDFDGIAAANTEQSAFISKTDYTGKKQYITVQGDTTNKYTFTDIAVLSDGNIAACGYRYSANSQSVATIYSYIYVYSPDGTQVSKYYLKSTDTDSKPDTLAYSITAIPGGLAVCGGSASKVKDFSARSSSEYDECAFIFTFDLDLNITGSKFYSGSMSPTFRSIDCDDSGNIFASCIITEADGDFASCSGLMGKGFDTVIYKFDTSLNEIWNYALSSSGNDSFDKVVANGTGGCAVTGQFTRVGYKAPDGTLSGMDYYAGIDSAIIILNSDGSLRKAVTFSGAEDDCALDICAFSGGYAVAGYSTSSNGSFAANNGEDDGFIILLSPAGNITSKINNGGSRRDVTSAVACSGNILGVFGHSLSTDVFFSGLNSNVSEESTAYDCWFTKYVLTKG